MTRAILTEIVDQHAEEAAFLWILRNEAIRAPNQDLDSLADLDERIDAHLDGLRVAGAHGWETCVDQLAWREAGEVFAAANIALQSRIGRRLDIVLDVASESIELARGFVGALAWLPYGDVERTVASFLNSDDRIVRRIGLAASAAHRRDPGVALGIAALDSDLSLRARALKAAAELGRRDLLPICAGDTEAGASELHFWNAWSAALLGDDQSTGALREIARPGDPYAEAAADLATRRMAPNDALVWHGELASSAASARLAIFVAGALGDPSLVPWLLDTMHREELARAAGEAFTSITGVELGGARLSAMRPDGFESGPNDDPNDHDVAIDPDEHLPWPQPAAVARWWSANSGSFVAGERYLRGRPISPTVLQEVLLRGRQRQRAAAALELVLREPGRPLFEVRARADRQLRALGTSAHQ